MGTAITHSADVSQAPGLAQVQPGGGVVRKTGGSGDGRTGVGEGPLRIAQEGGVRFTLGRQEGGSERRPEEPCVQLGLDNRSCGGCSFIVCIR